MPRVGSGGRLSQHEESYTGGMPRSSSFERLKDLGSMHRDRSYDRLDKIYDQMSTQRMRRERSFDKIQQAGLDRRPSLGQGMPRTMSSEHLGGRMTLKLEGQPPEAPSAGGVNPYADQGLSLADRLHGMPRVGNGMSRNSSHNSLSGLDCRPRLAMSREGSRQNLVAMDQEAGQEEVDEGCLLGDTLFVF